MIDERVRIQENYDMTMETAIDEAREEGIEKGLEQGLERGLKQGLERGRHEERLELIHKRDDNERRQEDCLLRS